MKNVYVLEIPDLHQVLRQDEIAVWELFLLTKEKRYKKVRFHVSSSGGLYTFTNLETSDSILGTVEIDFDSQKLIFYQAASDENKFEDFLYEMLSRLFVRVDKSRIQFLSSSKKRHRKRIDKR